MSRKRNCLIIPLVSASLLSGCAAQATDNTYAPVPLALIEAAEQASQMRMVYADWQARAHGHTVESIRLDSRDADAPDFMRAMVRLDYNGPMENVLTRVANDIGYRLNEYAKPSAGLSWTPWIRLSGNKTLLDHVREMNSQVPWHIVLDHQNRRLVVDYSDDGSTAAQIRSARASLQEDKPRTGANLPASPEQLGAGGRRAVAQTLSNGPALPSSVASVATPPHAAPDEVWFVAIEGYATDANARSMVIWLAQLGLSAHAHEVSPGRHDVRVLAENSRDAIQLGKLLEEHGVPSQIGYEDTDANDEIKRRAEQAMRDGWPIQAVEAEASAPATSYQPQAGSPVEAATSQAQTQRADTERRFTGSQSDLRSLSQNHILSDEEVREAGRHWSIQLSFSNSMTGLGRAIHGIEGLGFTTGLIPQSRGNYLLRATGFESREAANAALAQLRSRFSDAYLVKPTGE